MHEGWYEFSMSCSACSVEMRIVKLCMSIDRRIMMVVVCPKCGDQARGISTIDAMLRQVATVYDQPAQVQ